MIGPVSAARTVGLKLLMLAASFGAFAAAVQTTGEVSFADANWGGMKLLHLILGTMGAGASLFFLPQFNGKWLGATVTCGVVCAVLGTPALGWAFAEYVSSTKASLPGPVENLLAMALGVTGVYIIPAAMRAGAAIKANPLGFVDWLRGRGAAPNPPPEDKGGRP